MALEETTADAEWRSYRDAYREMIRFEKYGRPKQLIQSHLQIVPLERGVPLDGVRLALTGGATHLEMPLDAAGRAVFPLSKPAYDDNARLVLNRKAGQFAFQRRISIAPRADGVYDLVELRAACEQALDFLRYSGQPGMQDKHCVGVRFSYPRQNAEAAPRLRGSERPVAALEDGAPFPGDAGPTLRVATLSFADLPEKGQLVSPAAPVGIAPLFR
ncbi:hypothetical protein E4K72_19380 [Oxalobacteraceae bacterium OM1]|nr:hypothetical protein E4K72_19380 [Oxalobacteraceae bacterium OM1]